MLMTPDVQALRSARRRISVLYMAGSGGEAATLDLRLAIDEIDAALESVPEVPDVNEPYWNARAENDRAKLAAIAQLCDEAEYGATRWHDPLPVPEWVERVRDVLRSGAK